MPTKKIPRDRLTVFFDNGGHQDYYLNPLKDKVDKTLKAIKILKDGGNTEIEIDRTKVTHVITTHMLLDAAEVELQKRILAGEESDTGE